MRRLISNIRQVKKQPGSGSVFRFLTGSGDPYYDFGSNTVSALSKTMKSLKFIQAQTRVKYSKFFPDLLTRFKVRETHPLTSLGRFDFQLSLLRSMLSSENLNNHNTVYKVTFKCYVETGGPVYTDRKFIW